MSDFFILIRLDKLTVFHFLQHVSGPHPGPCLYACFKSWRNHKCVLFTFNPDSLVALINLLSAEGFSAVQSSHADVNSLKTRSAVLDKVAPSKMRLVPSINPSPWVKDTVRGFQFFKPVLPPHGRWSRPVGVSL